MSDDFKIQFSAKTPRDSLLNLRAQTPEEFQALQQWALGNAARFIDLETAIKTVPSALAGNVTHVQVQQDQPSAGANAYAAAQNYQQQQPNGGAPAGPGPACMHGPKNFKSGQKKNGKGMWQAWDCPQNICDRQWV